MVAHSQLISDSALDLELNTSIVNLEGSTSQPSLLLNSVTSIFINWTSRIDVYFSPQQTNIQMHETRDETAGWGEGLRAMESYKNNEIAANCACFHSVTIIGVRGEGAVGVPPLWPENFQGRLCFQGKRKFIKNPEWRKINIKYIEFRA